MAEEKTINLKFASTKCPKCENGTLLPVFHMEGKGLMKGAGDFYWKCSECGQTVE